MDDLTPDELALIQQHRRERATAATTAAITAENETRPPSENDDNIDKDDEPNEDDPLGKEKDTEEEEVAREIVPKGYFKLPLPPTDVGYSSKEHLCEEVQKFAIQHGYTLIKKRSDDKQERISLHCDHGLTYKPRVKDEQRKRNNY